MTVTFLGILVPVFDQPMQEEKLVDLWHSTNHLLKSARPDECLFACHSVKILGQFVIRIVQLLAFLVNVVSEMQPVYHF